MSEIVRWDSFQGQGSGQQYGTRMHPTDKSKHPKDKSKHPTDKSKHPTDNSKHPEDNSMHQTDKSRHQTPKNLKRIIKKYAFFHRFSTRIKDAGIAIRHSRGYTFFYTAGSINGLEGVNNRRTCWLRA